MEIPSDEDDVSQGEISSYSADDTYLEPSFSGLTEASIRPGIVHRLDKGTSGLLVVAKVPQTRCLVLNPYPAIWL